MRALGYPRRRKNGGQSEAGAQPCRFIARRATNGAPPSEATPHTSFALLGYPRSRKNGGTAEAGVPEALRHSKAAWIRCRVDERDLPASSEGRLLPRRQHDRARARRDSRQFRDEP